VFGQSGAPGPDHGIAAVVGTSDRNTGVAGDSNQAPGVFGLGRAGVVGTSGDQTGIFGASDTGRGVLGQSGAAGPDLGIAAVGGTSANATGVSGSSGSSYGGLFSGGQAPLRLVPASTQGPPTGGAHQVGEFFVDRDGNLFFCKASGPPPTWFRIA